MLVSLWHLRPVLHWFRTHLPWLHLEYWFDSPGLTHTVAPSVGHDPDWMPVGIGPEGDVAVVLWVAYVTPEGEPLAETDLTHCDI